MYSMYIFKYVVKKLIFYEYIPILLHSFDYYYYYRIYIYIYTFSIKRMPSGNTIILYLMKTTAHSSS